MSNKMLCIGDSNTYGYDPRSYVGSRYPEGIRWTSRLDGWAVVNRGLNGMKVPLSAERHAGIIRAEEPDIVTVMLGTNDILSGVGAEQTAVRMEEFIIHIKAVCKKILIISPPYLELGEWVQDEDYIEESYELAEHMQGVAKRQGCMFADAADWDIELSYDGVHFSEAGHIAFAERIMNIIGGALAAS